MPPPTDEELIEVWQQQPSPLLPMLHAFHDRDGYLSEASLRAVSAALVIPIAELFGTVTFYHHFSQEPGGLERPRVCTGNVCRLRGAGALLEALEKDGGTAMPCSGRCDEAGIPVLRGHTTCVGTWPQNLRPKPSEVPAPNPGNIEECVFSQIRAPGRATLDGYRGTGGFEGLIRCLKEMTPAEVVQLIMDSKLAGRGGAGFPTGVKWKAVAEAVGQPKSIVCNADEGEPGCFKDRALMDYDPFSLIEGMILAGFACGAPRGFIYLRYEYPETAVVLQKCIDELTDAEWLGQNILGSGFSFQMHLRRGAGAYICGEESSLLNSLEGKHPFPRNKPPYPVTHGLDNLPTAVNNVETFCAATHIARRGAAWYRGLGLNDHAGTKLISISGDIQRPGNYEVPFGLPLRTLLFDWAGGPPEGREIQAVTMAGLSGGFLAGEALDRATLDEPSIRSFGSFLGAGGIIVFDDSRDMVEMAHAAMEFFAHESCGKCFPCRIGTERLTERLSATRPRQELQSWVAEMRDIGSTMKATSACGLGMAAPHVTESLMKYFPDQVARHVSLPVPR